MNFECPDVQVRQGAATMSASTNQAEPSALNMRFQISMGATARECRLLPGNILSMKVGMQGRVILGPEGAPGSGPRTVDIDPTPSISIRSTLPSLLRRAGRCPEPPAGLRVVTVSSVSVAPLSGAV